MNRARVIHHTARVEELFWTGGVVVELGVTVAPDDYDAYEACPLHLRYDGRAWVKKGWNSDSGMVTYGPTDRVAAGLDRSPELVCGRCGADLGHGMQLADGRVVIYPCECASKES